MKINEMVLHGSNISIEILTYVFGAEKKIEIKWEKNFRWKINTDKMKAVMLCEVYEKRIVYSDNDMPAELYLCMLYLFDTHSYAIDLISCFFFSFYFVRSQLPTLL